jgi:hypothetical protein
MFLLHYGLGHWPAARNLETLVEPMPGGLELFCQVVITCLAPRLRLQYGASVS